MSLNSPRVFDYSTDSLRDRPKYYVPRNHFATPGYYPQEPSGQFASASLFSKFDVDTLFYVFYYCQGTYLQYVGLNSCVGIVLIVFSYQISCSSRIEETVVEISQAVSYMVSTSERAAVHH